VNGIGERAGNASLDELVVALRVRSDHYAVETGVDTSRLAAASRLVADAPAGSSSRTRPSSAQTRSRTRRASIRTGC
jgi:Isopropylmalate/homocitrate/citramalate synthases